MNVRRVSMVIAIHVEATDDSAESVMDRLMDAEEEQDELIDVVSELLKPFTELTGDYIIEHPSIIVTTRK